jgi:hypothetical protein
VARVLVLARAADVVRVAVLAAVVVGKDAVVVVEFRCRW